MQVKIMNEKRTIKCRICGKTRVILDSELAEIIENNYLKMGLECEIKAKKLKLDFPFKVESESLLRDYINKLRGVDIEIK